MAIKLQNNKMFLSQDTIISVFNRDCIYEHFLNFVNLVQFYGA